ncbi:hypothetical protein Shyd_77880 [Streptomyces hydrogenans]|uniref:Uncharacterized protein n=1 Tax=Streptomyces hydrogenans TaxID=1873719 RepID=A0ABQ3PN30_9ACTN|nr:hypothetical protein Shyd_77880 [Streptomyces hydrogenans]
MIFPPSFPASSSLSLPQPVSRTVPVTTAATAAAAVRRPRLLLEVRIPLSSSKVVLVVRQEVRPAARGSAGPAGT